MFNISELISDKTGVVVFVRKDGEFYCSESFDEALKEIFNTKASVEYIDLDSNYRTMRVDAVADVANKIITLRMPKECGSNGCNLRLTFSAENGITAEEDNPGGGSGGVSSWNDLTDKPFYEETKQGYILPETTVPIDDEGMGSIMNAPAAPLILGETYKVVWNGTEYNCVAQALDAFMAGAFALGNIGAVTGGEMTDDPFLIVLTPFEAGGVWGLVLPLDGSVEMTFSVYGTIRTLKTLEEKFLPANIKPAFFVRLEQPEPGVYTLAEGITFSDIYAAASAGRVVYLVETREYGVCILATLSSIDPTKNATFANMEVNGIGVCINAYMIDIDGTVHASNGYNIFKHVE